MNKQQYNRFEKLLRGADASHVTVSLDWLSVLFMDETNSIPVPSGDDFVYEASDTITLVYTGKGNEHYKHIYHLQYNGEHLATILAHTRNKKFVAEGTVKVDMKNHLLYSVDLWKVYHEIETLFRLKYRNISRVDIAIDGMNYLIDFLNMYHKQTGGQKVVNMVNRARFNANVLDQRTMLYQNFLIGSKKGIKKITIYNKSLDIVKTGKNYIQLFWKQNGIIERLIDIQAQQEEVKKVKEKMYLDGDPNVYRFELRLKGESVKGIAGFNIAMLKTVEGLISIVKLMTNNFFEFRQNLYTEKHSEKNPRLNLIPFQKFKIENLVKIPREIRQDLYKAKLALNMNVRGLYLESEQYRVEDATVYDAMRRYILSFNLHQWFEDKFIGSWMKLYSKQNSNKEHTDAVTNMLYSFIEGLTPTDATVFAEASAAAMAQGEQYMRDDYKAANPYLNNFLPDDFEMEDSPF